MSEADAESEIAAVIGRHERFGEILQVISYSYGRRYSDACTPGMPINSYPVGSVGV